MSVSTQTQQCYDVNVDTVPGSHITPKTCLATQSQIPGTFTLKTTSIALAQSLHNKECVRLVSYGGGGGGSSGGGGGQGGGGSGGGGSGGGGSGGGGGASSANVPIPVAAIIHAAVDECVYWTYQENTTDTGLTNLFSYLGLGALGGGAYVIASGGSSIASGLLTGTGAGITLLQNASKIPPTALTTSVSSITQAGLAYYSLMKARAAALSSNDTLPPEKRVMSGYQKEAALSGLWDAAGSACSPGILKGRGLFTEHPAALAPPTK